MIKTTTAKVAVIGGGSGCFNLLQAFKRENWDLSALVNMADNGGSSGVLRDELGVLPPGDIRQCLVALSQSPKMRDLFSDRFDTGGLKGQSFGNLFLSATQEMTDNFGQAVALAGEVLRVAGRVIPITNDDVQLVAKLADGRIINGEYQVAQADMKGNGQRAELSLRPRANLSADARAAIGQADLIVIAPGNLYGSLAPALIVGGLQEALAKTSARIVYICNLVTKPGQTDGYKVHDYAGEIERFIGRPLLDWVIYNIETPAPEVLKKYVHEDEFLVGADADQLNDRHYKSVGLPLIAGAVAQCHAADVVGLQRSLIRHEAVALAAQINKIINRV
ncbi:MAG: gluconeogenesis factor YvcK family protein [Candidatus Saccharimonadales bacterium]